MSASDAAPLPRLGEVFFDVRGESRSMRLSWYADTGVAVFSIWQGGRCTGTFRLPIEDLDRMIEILRRGPQSGRQRGRTDGPGRDGYGPGGYGPGGRGADGPGPDNYGTEIYSPEGYRPGPDGYGPDGGYGPEGYGDDYGSDSHGRDDYGPDSHGRDDYENADPRATQYLGAGYAGGRRAGSPADYQASGYADREYPTGAYWQDDGGHPLEDTGQEPFAESDYGQDRFVPPYVQAASGSYQNDNPGGGGGRRRAVDPGAYPGADRGPGTDYRPTADPGTGSRHSAGRHSSL